MRLIQQGKSHRDAVKGHFRGVTFAGHTCPTQEKSFVQGSSIQFMDMSSKDMLARDPLVTRMASSVQQIRVEGKVPYVHDSSGVSFSHGPLVQDSPVQVQPVPDIQDKSVQHVVLLVHRSPSHCMKLCSPDSVPRHGPAHTTHGR